MEKKKTKRVILSIILILSALTAVAYGAATYQSTDVYYQKAGGGEMTVKAALDELYRTKVDKIFKEGDSVSYGGDRYYVIKDVYEGQRDMEIMCSYCIGLPFYTMYDGSATSSQYGTKFATGTYWASYFSSGSILNLNCVVPDMEKSSIVGSAMRYALAKDAISGRLLTKEEADYFKSKANYGNNYYHMLWQDAQWGNSEGSISYWLGSGSGGSSTDVYVVSGPSKSISTVPCYCSWTGYGIRPVIQVKTENVTY